MVNRGCKVVCSWENIDAGKSARVARLRAAAGGFVGNEAVAIFRIRVGSAMNSAALIADGFHARTDCGMWVRGPCIQVISDKKGTGHH